MNKIVCGHCRAENPSDKHFCKKCGAFLHADQFSRDVIELPELKMMRVVDNLITLPHQPIGWDDLTDAYARRIERLKALYNLPELGKDTNTSITDKIDDFLARCRNPDFQIAFVGTIKTGKSTLINALLGKNYASMDVTPETAALTKFRASVRDYIKLTFYTHREWQQLMASRTRDAADFMREYNELGADSRIREFVGKPELYKEVSNARIESELTLWSSSKHAEHYFVKEIEVGISTLGRDFPSQVVFVDTPGLSDPVQYRSDLTREYIRRANAVFMCVDASKMQDQDIETISSVFSFVGRDNKNKVHIIATHWDQLNDPEKDWSRQKAYWTKLMSNGAGFFDTREQANENIMHSAAYICNLCRDYDTLDRKQKRKVDRFAEDFDLEMPDDLGKVRTLTNIPEIMKVIRYKLVDNYKKMQLSDLAYRYKDILYNLKRITIENRDSARELLSSSMADDAELQQKLEAQRLKRDGVQQISVQLTNVLKNAKYKTQRRAETICGKLRVRLSELN